MKKFLSLLFFLTLLISVNIQAQKYCVNPQTNTTIVKMDVVKPSADSIVYVPVLTDAYALTTISVQYVFTVTGTCPGNAYFEGSVDGSNWYSLNTTAWTTTGTTAIVSINPATAIWFRIHYVKGSGSGSASIVSTVVQKNSTVINGKYAVAATTPATIACRHNDSIKYVNFYDANGNLQQFFSTKEVIFETAVTDSSTSTGNIFVQGSLNGSTWYNTDTIAWTTTANLYKAKASPVEIYYRLKANQSYANLGKATIICTAVQKLK